MARKTSAKAKVVLEEPIGSVYESLGVADPGAKSRAKPEDGDGPSMKDLIAQISALGKQVEGLQAGQMAFLSTPQQVQTKQPTPQKPKVDLSGLPDPLVDPKGYEKGLNDRLEAAISGQIAQITSAQQAQTAEKTAGDGRVAALWEDFGEKYADLAAHPEIIEVAATKVVTRAQKKGLDVNRYMFGPGSSFLDDVAKEMKTRYGKLLDVDEGEGDADAQGGEEGGDEDPSAGRTDGMFGGAVPGAKPDDGGSKQKPGDMLDDLKAFQKMSGMF
jgi:hypothetical protein